MNSFKWTVSPVPARQQITGVWSAAKGILYPQKKPHPRDSREWLFVAVTRDALLLKRVLVPEFYLWDKTNPRTQQSPVSATETTCGPNASEDRCHSGAILVFFKSSDMLYFHAVMRSLIL